MTKRYLSGIQATGIPHVGNYLGALKNWVASQEDGHEAFYMIADLHAITVPTEPDVLRSNRLGAMFGMLAAGLDPSRVTLFYQSKVRAHTELSWLLGAYASYGELQRMTQFKTKKETFRDSVSLDLFAYPVLQSADILLYQPDYVPIGEDQVQHIELTRNIVSRCNQKFGDLFKMPEAVVPEIGARVMDLQDPTKKMSKSGSPSGSGVIFLTDTNDVIKRKISRAVTDSLNAINYNDEQDGVRNLLDISAGLTNTLPENIAEDLKGKGYGALKSLVTDQLVETISPIRNKIEIFLDDPEQVSEMLHPCLERANTQAEDTLSSAKNAFGF